MSSTVQKSEVREASNVESATDSSPLRRALRRHFELFKGLTTAKHPDMTINVLYQDASFDDNSEDEILKGVKN